ncbi:MAG: hypothetical protein L3J05_00910 [Robiginitomaculum sp.]|nr:hypothetical protein [Robiginitomaculum sp.]
MERNIFPKNEVFSKFGDFVLVQQFTDDSDDSRPAKNLVKYSGKGVAVPLYMVLDKNGKEIARLTPPTAITSLTGQEFAAFMASARQKYEAEFGKPTGSESKPADTDKPADETEQQK